MIVICNSSPLIALLSIKRLDILNKLFKKVIVPEAVYREVFKAKSILETSKIFQIEQVKDKNLVKLLRMHLDCGESEAIALAIEQGIDRVIIDDKQARKIADKQGLKVIGTLGILMLAKKKQIIKEVRPLILNIMENINFRISERILNKALEFVGEKEV